jgi:hypothetical protein
MGLNAPTPSPAPRNAVLNRRNGPHSGISYRTRLELNWTEA